jgi:hypothetical protein
VQYCSLVIGANFEEGPQILGSADGIGSPHQWRLIVSVLPPTSTMAELVPQHAAQDGQRAGARAGRANPNQHDPRRRKRFQSCSAVDMRLVMQNDIQQWLWFRWPL